MLCDEILPLDPGEVDQAFESLEDHREISIRDAIHAATMLRRGFERILSTDTHFDVIEGIVRVNPLALSQPPEREPEQAPDRCPRPRT